jgi:hypothetical protein
MILSTTAGIEIHKNLAEFEAKSMGQICATNRDNGFGTRIQTHGHAIQ